MSKYGILPDVLYCRHLVANARLDLVRLRRSTPENNAKFTKDWSKLADWVNDTQIGTLVRCEQVPQKIYSTEIQGSVTKHQISETPPDSIDVTCWCERSVLKVPFFVFKQGRTLSCGTKKCNALSK